MNLLDRRFLNLSLSVQGIVNDPGEDYSTGTQYIVGENPTGDFSGARTNSIARYDGSDWKFLVPQQGGLEVINLSTAELLAFDGSSWNSVATLGSGGGNPVSVVDGIVYGFNFQDNPLTLTALSALKGRPFLDNRDGSVWRALHKSPTLSLQEVYTLDTYFDDVTSFAAFSEGKIYSVNGSDFSCSELAHDAVILNKEDNCLYRYDATNHKFIRLGGHRCFVVDEIVDYVGSNIPANKKVNGAKVIQIWNSDIGLYYLTQSTLDNQVYEGSEYVLEKDFSFANISGVLSDEPAVYITVGNDNSAEAIRAVHDLLNGDILFCKSDGCSYIFVDDGTNQSFVKISSQTISPVLDIVQVGAELPDTASVGDKFIVYDPSYGEMRLLYTATAANTWNDGENIPEGARYACSDNHKIFVSLPSIYEQQFEFQQLDIPVGATFFNKADNSLYLYDGQSFINVSGAGGTAAASYEPVAPVLAIVKTGTALPATAVMDDLFLNTSTTKLYTATAINTWNNGVNTSSGSRYASASDFKIYQNNGSGFSVLNIPDGDLFLNKYDNSVYAYDASIPAFIKVSGGSPSGSSSPSSSSSFITEFHTLTEQEAAQRYFVLSYAVAAGQERNVLLFVSGIAQTPGVDFTVDGDEEYSNKLIDWSIGNDTNINLTEGDTFLIHYVKA